MTTDKQDRRELRQRLSPLQYHVTQEAGTERAFTGEYWDCKDDGVYHCVVCGIALFSSDTKYDSGTGWPSFHSEMGTDRVGASHRPQPRPDPHRGGLQRMRGALGAHLRRRPPPPTGERYCMNSASLNLHRDDASDGVSDDASPG